jgi:hypothetical protein
VAQVQVDRAQHTPGRQHRHAPHHPGMCCCGRRRSCGRSSRDHATRGVHPVVRGSGLSCSRSAPAGRRRNSCGIIGRQAPAKAGQVDRLRSMAAVAPQMKYSRPLPSARASTGTRATGPPSHDAVAAVVGRRHQEVQRHLEASATSLGCRCAASNGGCTRPTTGVTW